MLRITAVAESFQEAFGFVPAVVPAQIELFCRTSETETASATGEEDDEEAEAEPDAP